MQIKIVNDTGNKLSAERLEEIRETFAWYLDPRHTPYTEPLDLMAALDVMQVRGAWEDAHPDDPESIFTGYDYSNQAWITVTVTE